MEDKTQIQKVENMLGMDWKRERYHNLVRLGGDAIACGLHEYSKATILGGLLSLPRIRNHEYLLPG